MLGGIVFLMGPWALIAARFRFVALLDDFFAYSLSGSRYNHP
jgi:hypothetical protein